MADNNPANQASVVPTSALSPVPVAGDPAPPIDHDKTEELAHRRQLAHQLRRRAVQAQRCADTVPSPCLSVCRLNANNGFCEGCFRTLSEISRWSRGGPDWQKKLWLTILQRLDHTNP